MTPGVDLIALRTRIREFVAAREWDQFHNPKNLTMALVREASELVEIFQWLTPEEAASINDDPQQREAVAEELADCLYYVIRLADRLDIDLGNALLAKLELNAAKYPVDSSRGSARKYSRSD